MRKIGFRKRNLNIDLSIDINSWLSHCSDFFWKRPFTYLFIVFLIITLVLFKIDFNKDWKLICEFFSVIITFCFGWAALLLRLSDD